MNIYLLIFIMICVMLTPVIHDIWHEIRTGQLPRKLWQKSSEEKKKQMSIASARVDDRLKQAQKSRPTETIDDILARYTKKYIDHGMNINEKDQ
ncbi:MAG: hypothetical protein IKR92_03785, partial [Alphaproteobacteria bacterium]|nr:hypothetical protein [Alphaproteobacteria bacterium]